MIHKSGKKIDMRNHLCAGRFRNSRLKNFPVGVFGNSSIISTIRGYLLVAFLAALGGGLAMAIATRAIPTIMSRMMRNMMAGMDAEGLNPEEL